MSECGYEHWTLNFIVLLSQSILLLFNHLKVKKTPLAREPYRNRHLVRFVLQANLLTPGGPAVLGKPMLRIAGHRHKPW